MAAQALASAHAVRLVAQVEIAFGDLLAAQQSLELRRAAFDAADAAATVRERMHAAGAASDLAQARDRDAREQARISVARAEAELELRRERLNALLGLTGTQTAWTATGALPELPVAPPALDALETKAVAANLDLAAGRAKVGGATNRAGEERMRTVLPELGVGVSVHDESGHGTSIGPMIRIGIPLLDWRGGERMRANAEVRARRGPSLPAGDQAEHVLHEIELELRVAAEPGRAIDLERTEPERSAEATASDPELVERGGETSAVRERDLDRGGLIERCGEQGGEVGLGLGAEPARELGIHGAAHFGEGGRTAGERRRNGRDDKEAGHGSCWWCE